MENLRDPKDVIIGDKTLAELIAIHNEWLQSAENYVNPPVKLANADLSNVNLESVNFSHIDMIDVNFEGSNLRNAYLHMSTMTRVIFNDTCLYNAKMGSTLQTATSFDGADLSFANLQCAHMYLASFDNTNLYGVNFDTAVIDRASFYHSKCKEASFVDALIFESTFKDTSLESATVSYKTEWIHTSFDDKSMVNSNIRPLACPSHGSFIAWKFARLRDNSDRILVKLEIPEDAQRSSSTTNMCRASKAKVLEVENLCGDKLSDDTEIVSDFDPGFTYKAGDIIEPDRPFDNNRWHGCASGIHFFIDKRDAIVMAKGFIQL